MRYILTALFLIISIQAQAAILVLNPTTGSYSPKSTLAAVLADSSTANKTIVVTSALTQTQSNITGAWPANRALKVEKGGSVANSTAFAFADGNTFTADKSTCFVGSGVITGLRLALPEWFGGNGDGATDNRPSIVKAVQSLSSGGELSFGSGTYLVASYQNATSKKIIELTSANSNIVISGHNTTIKVANGLNTATSGFHAIFGSAGDTLVENVTFKNITFDMNGTNNIIPNSTWWTNAAILLNYCSKITIQNNNFINNAGYNSIVLGSHDTSVATKCIISNNRFLEFAHSLAGNTHTTDHSCIYVAGKDISILQNMFLNSNKCTVSTAIECDASYAVVSGNIVRNTKIGVIVATTPSAPSLSNSTVTANTMEYVDIAYSVWVLGTGETARGLNFSNNQITLSCPQYEGGLQYYINLYTWIDASNFVSDIIISGNTMYTPSITINAKQWTGIGVKNSNGVKIFGNTLHDLTGPGIYITDSTHVSISDNIIYDTARSTNTTTVLANAIKYTGTVTRVDIINNTIYDTLASTTPYMSCGLYFYGNIQQVNIINNTINVGVSKEIDTGGVTVSGIGFFNVDHTITTPLPASARPIYIRASIKSKIFDSVNNIQYVNTNNLYDGTGWRSISYSNVIPTSSGSSGDRVINTNPTLAGVTEWVCVSTTTWGKIALLAP